MSRIPEFIQYLESKVGNIYVWGAQGQVVTDLQSPELWIRARETTDENAMRAIAFYKEVLATGKSPIEAYDCSGLIMYYIQNIKHWSKGDNSAEGLYHTSTKLTKSELQPGDLCFIINAAGRMHHVGVYIGNGQTIEAYGRDLGVVKRMLSQGEWTHFGRLPVLQINDEEEEVKVAKVFVKSTTPDPLVKQLQELLNNCGYPCGKADGEFGALTDNAFQAFKKAHGMVTDALPDVITIVTVIGNKDYKAM
jgi:hypothetical protein